MDRGFGCFRVAGLFLFSSGPAPFAAAIDEGNGDNSNDYCQSQNLLGGFFHRGTGGL